MALPVYYFKKLIKSGLWFIHWVVDMNFGEVQVENGKDPVKAVKVREMMNVYEKEIGTKSSTNSLYVEGQ